MQEQKVQKQGKDRKPREDILSIVKQFISYFEEADRREKNGDSIKRG